MGTILVVYSSWRQELLMFLLDWPGGSWEATAKLVVAIIGIYLIALWLTLIFWTIRDIRQRSRDPIAQVVATLLVAVFFLPGHWIYLILRPRYTLVEVYERSLEEEALLQELEDQKACPTCKRRISDEFLVCPSCRTQLKEPCRSCAKPLSYAWMACPYCGLEKAPREGYGPRAQRNQVRNAAPSRPQPMAQEATRPILAREGAAPLPRTVTRRASDDGPVIDSTVE